MVQFIYPKELSISKNTFENVLDAFDDGFSGWFSISSEYECNDFCFWQLNMELSNEKDRTKIFYDSNNTADPHKITQIKSTYQVSNNISTQISSHWTCAMNIFQKINHKGSLGELVKLTSSGYFGKEFQYLRCMGPGEKTNDVFTLLSENIYVWYSILLLFVLVNFLSGSKLQLCCRLMNVTRSRKYRQSDLSIAKGTSSKYQEDICIRGGDKSLTETISVGTNTSIGEKTTELSGQDIEHDTNITLEDMLHTEDKTAIADKIFKLPSLVIEDPSHSDSSLGSNVNIETRMKYKWTFILVFSVIMSLMSFIILLELLGVSVSNYHWISILTPSCSAINVACQQGEISIEKPSVPYTRSRQGNDSNNPLFSYLIISDTQSNWFGNEFPELGNKKIPSICKEGIDTYESCTSKYGRYSNQQMKKAIEVYTKSKEINSLIINGDLTSYFHPKERREYESVFHKIKGLKKFYPSLGNHDYHHKAGATYGGDQWLGNPKKCNALHALDYIRGGFCGRIPKFPFNDIVRYDSKSLAYSWEEGPYHFVHTHFYPSYENNQIGLQSSLSWLKRDISLAAEANLTTILYIHSASEFKNNPLAEDIVNKENKVAAIFSGHSHRCLMKKCMQPHRVFQPHIQW